MTRVDSVYIIRDVAFGRDFTPKLIMGVVALALALWDARRQHRADYLWVAAFGTAIWGCAEWLLALQRIRDMPERVLFGTPLANAPSYLLRGAGEPRWWLSWACSWATAGWPAGAVARLWWRSGWLSSPRRRSATKRLVSGIGRQRPGATCSTRGRCSCWAPWWPW